MNFGALHVFRLSWFEHTLVESVKDACQVLTQNLERRDLTREQIVAYATLAGFAHHWPSQSTDEIGLILKKYEWIREAEYGRYLKQRRIAIASLSKAVTASG